MIEDQQKDFRLNIRIPVELRNEFYRVCNEDYVKPSEKIRSLIVDYIRESKENKRRREQ